MALHFFSTSTVDPRISEIRNLANDGTTVLSDFTYQYNAVGEITNWVQTQGTNPRSCPDKRAGLVSISAQYMMQLNK